MKTPSGTIKLATLATIAAALVACGFGIADKDPCPLPNPDQEDPPLPECAMNAASKEEFVLRTKHRFKLKDPSTSGEAVFKDLLNNGHYSASKGNRIHFSHTKVSEGREWLPTQKDASSATQLEIKTDKVTVSKSVESLSTEDLTLISPHVTQQIAVSTKEDVTAVLKLLEP